MQVAKLVTCANYATWWSTLESLTGIFFWTEFAFFLAIFQVIESIPWVRCASGNVFVCAEDTENTLKYCKKIIVRKCGAFVICKECLWSRRGQLKMAVYFFYIPGETFYLQELQTNSKSQLKIKKSFVSLLLSLTFCVYSG